MRKIYVLIMWSISALRLNGMLAPAQLKELLVARCHPYADEYRAAVQPLFDAHVRALRQTAQRAVGLSPDQFCRIVDMPEQLPEDHPLAERPASYIRELHTIYMTTNVHCYARARFILCHESTHHYQHTTQHLASNPSQTIAIDSTTHDLARDEATNKLCEHDADLHALNCISDCFVCVSELRDYYYSLPNIEKLDVERAEQGYLTCADIHARAQQIPPTQRCAFHQARQPLVDRLRHHVARQVIPMLRERCPVPPQLGFNDGMPTSFSLCWPGCMIVCTC